MNQGTFTEEESLIPLTSLIYFRSAAFDFANIIYFFLKASYLNEEVDCAEPSP
jgi:hypothetical protein